jgi:hypothetical protein
MNSHLRIPLTLDTEQLQRLLALQSAFSQVCNALAPQVQATRCWNRVALHHMAYKTLREQFPAMGSQMVCNAIYSVSRTSRLLFQHPQSPFHLSKLGNRKLPLLKFSDSCPVYFDRHTLSFKAGQLSMYTLDGRMRFQLDLLPQQAVDFQQKKLREIVLGRLAQGGFELAFWFSDEADETLAAPVAAADGDADAAAAAEAAQMEIPEYILVEEAEAA